jgi:hypothetical protein
MATESQPTYPQLSAKAAHDVAERLAEVVARYHGDGLAPDQLAELRSRIAIQLAAAGRLHRFPLNNAQEPIFVVRADEGGIA